MPELPKGDIQVLYVDDETNNLTSFKAAFRRSFKVFTATSGSEGRGILERESIQVIISDQRMPHMTGIEFFESILNDFPDPVRILLTGYADIGAVIDAINKGRVFKYLSKPWNEEELKKNIEEAFLLYTRQKEEKEMNTKLSETNQKMEFILRQNLIS